MSKEVESQGDSRYETAKKNSRHLGEAIVAITIFAGVLAATPSRGQPTPIGACCLNSGGCIGALDAFTCSTSAGGVFAGENSVCSSATCAGACCQSDGHCISTDPTACLGQQGDFHGVVTTCAATVCGGACCSANGGCRSSSPGACSPDEFLGLGTLCGQSDCLGACCHSDGDCFDAGTIGSCTQTAGEFRGRGTRCALTACVGACCLPEKDCVENTPTGCGQSGGAYQGDGTLCVDDCPTRLTTAFTYQGQLKRGGTPVSDVVNLEFSLWPLAVDGTQVGATLSRSGVEVVNGLFSVELDFGPTAFLGSSRWLQIAFDGTPLLPRQPLSATPYAVHALSAGNARALDAHDGSPANALFVNDEGDVGVGTTSPAGRFEVASGTNSYVRIDNEFGDLHFNGGSNGVFGLFNDSGAVGSTSIYGQGVPRLTVENTGRVGINTSSPVRPLHVFDGGQYTARFESTHTTATTMELRNASTNAMWEVGVTGSAQPLGLPAGSMYLLKQGQPTQGLSITPSGEVLIPGTLDIGIEDIQTPTVATRNLLVSCPPGKLAITGGCVCRSGEVYLSRPEGTGWHCGCSDTTFGDDGTTAYVRCARVR